MGLMKKLRGEFVDIIEWIDDSRSTLAWRFPRYNNEIKNGAELIVREGQMAMFVYRGQLADTFEPGHYTLTSEALPILSTLDGFKHGLQSPFRSEVYFINTRPVTNLRWGTPQPVTIKDPDFRMVQVRAHGLCVVKVDDPVIFLRQVIGTDSNVNVDEIAELLRRVIAVAFSDMIIDSGYSALELQGKQAELSDKLRGYVVERVDDEFGLGIPDIMMTISLPNEITEAMTRGVARGVEESGYVHNVGDIDRLKEVRMADAVLAAASNEGGSAMGDMMTMGMGMNLANQMSNGFEGDRKTAAAGTSAKASPGATPPPLPGAVGLEYYAGIDGAQAGPFGIAGLRDLEGSGQLTRETLVWSSGMTGWEPAATRPDLLELFTTPPPMPGV